MHVFEGGYKCQAMQKTVDKCKNVKKMKSNKIRAKGARK